jgi:hypothetical protein
VKENIEGSKRRWKDTFIFHMEWELKHPVSNKYEKENNKMALLY